MKYINWINFCGLFLYCLKPNFGLIFLLIQDIFLFSFFIIISFVIKILGNLYDILELFVIVVFFDLPLQLLIQKFIKNMELPKYFIRIFL